MAVPKLRFKEFNGDWKQEALKSLATFSKGKGISKADISEDGINSCIRYGELYTTYGQVIDHIQSKTNVSKSECVLSKAGDVIIPASGETQIDIATASCVLHDDIILSGDLNILRHEENGSWLAYYLSSAKKLEIAQLAQGNSVVHLYSSQLKDLKINKPSKEEQTEIASFLSTVDEKISQLSQKLYLLGQYKQGMMQKLFSQQIRFKVDDGSEFGEWEDVNLGEIVKIKSGYSPSKYDLKDKGNIPFLKVEELNNCVKFQKDSRFYVESFESDLILKNSIIFPKRGAAILNNKVRILSVDSLLDSNLMALIPSKSIFYEYLYYLVTFIELFKIADTSSIPQINNKHIEPYSVDLPCLEEQTKIANFLSAIDRKIEVVTQQIEQAKTWKKGLLQQMFV